MANDGKPQTFPYSYKTIAIPVNSQFSFNMPYLEVLNPVNILTSELLFTHLRIAFDPSIDPSLKVLKGITVTGLDDDGFTVRAAKGVTLNKAAVSNIVDVVIDLSPFIYKTGRNRITFEVPSVDSFGSITGTNIVQLWKADLAYTTKGVV